MLDLSVLGFFLPFALVFWILSRLIMLGERSKKILLIMYGERKGERGRRRGAFMQGGGGREKEEEKKVAWGTHAHARERE